ncbi:alpha-L-arabinofuranosidase C-terminal domain-containing protein [Actinopolymorpha sp. B11F2]|uniref:alpha-L-arabinofuranosidase C-terminal domain-containing protein n=1 Tax=Actinopolymorpha sp. B11F2 TaxID=3160862 RepID=UPI0032E4F2CC
MNHVEARIEIDRDREIGRIEENIYGHFLESSFFGNIEGGVFDEGSPHSYAGDGPRAGLRRDVIEACQQLGLPVVRWPGGNVASPYHWEDGVGPRGDRPRRLELAWGSEETNRFGTDEFLAWCAEVGTQPYLVHSCRDVDEAVRWVEYTNHTGDTDYTRRRAAGGHPDAYGVRYWGLGNEVYGQWQMGHRSPEEYAAAARDHAQFMRKVDPSIRLVAVGTPSERWTRPVLERVGSLVDYVSLHLYGASTHLYTADSGDDDYDAVVAQPLYFERQIHEYAHLVASLAAAAGVERPLALALDEWNIRHLEPVDWPEPQPSPDGAVVSRDTEPVNGRPARLRVNRWSPRTLADALFYAGVFHALHRASGLTVPPTMANTVNLVNANGLLAVRPGGVVRSPSYHVWNLYQNHTGTIAIHADVYGPARTGAVRQGDSRDGSGGFATRPGSVPMLDASATLTDDRRLRLAVINRSRTDGIRTRIILDGQAALPPGTVHDLGADESDTMAINTLDSPNRIRLRDRGHVTLDDGTYTFPPHSVTLLSFT